MEPNATNEWGPTSVGLLLVAFIFSGILGIGLLDPVQASKSNVLELRGKTEIIGSSSHEARVELETSAVFDTRRAPWREKGPNVRTLLQGAGRFFGIVLVKEGSEVSGRHRLVIGRWSRCDSEGSCLRPKSVNVVYPTGRKSITLPAGIYRLFLIADGEPVRIALDIRGLTGFTTIRPEEEAMVDIRTPKVRMSLEPEGQTLYTNGSHYIGSGAGLAMTMWSWESSAFRDTELHECVYVDNPPPEEVAYGPQCDALNVTGAGSDWRFSGFDGEKYDFTAASLWGFGGGVLPDVTGERGYGLWFRSVGKIDRTVSHGLFLSY